MVWPLITGEDKTIAVQSVPMFMASSVVPLIARQGERTWGLGTAFALSRNLDVLVTARHVIDCLDDVIGPLPGGYSPVVELDIEIFGLWPTSLEQPNNRHAAGITGITMRKNSDLALLAINRDGIDPRVAATMRGLLISTHSPRLGEQCLEPVDDLEGPYPSGDLEALKQDRRANAGRKGTTHAHRSSWSCRRR